MNQTMSDWQKAIRIKSLEYLAERYDTSKVKDLERLMKTDLPQLESKIFQFNLNDSALEEYFLVNSQRGWKFCVRALPTEEGLKKGHTRKPKLNISYFREAKSFLESVVDNPCLWNIGVTLMGEDIYGGVIISDEERTMGEIAKNLDKLTGGSENPFSVYYRKTGRPYGKWVRKGEGKEWLKQAIKLIGARKGYFEFVVTAKPNIGINFVDYKIKEGYLG